MGYVYNYKFMKKVFRTENGKYEQEKKGDRIIGRVYYNPESNKFLQIREKIMSGFKCSHDCDYFSDAKTTIQTQGRFTDEILGFVLVEDIEHFWGAYYDGVGWQVNRGGKEKEYFCEWGDIKKESETYQIEEVCDNCGCGMGT